MNKNDSIKCSVDNCKYNDRKDYCTLSQIKVGTHEANPSEIECTDCESFQIS
jgi:hypothetical protein